MSSLVKKIILGISLIITLFAWGFVGVNYSNLPEEVVAHMDLQGNVNRYDSKIILWFLLSIFTILMVLFFRLTKNVNQKQYSGNNVAKSVFVWLVAYLSIVLFGLCKLIINKTLIPEYNTNTFFIIFLGLTFLLVLYSSTTSIKNSRK